MTKESRRAGAAEYVTKNKQSINLETLIINNYFVPLHFVVLIIIVKELLQSLAQSSLYKSLLAKVQVQNSTTVGGLAGALLSAVVANLYTHTHRQIHFVS